MSGVDPEARALVHRALAEIEGSYTKGALPWARQHALRYAVALEHCQALIEHLVALWEPSQKPALESALLILKALYQLLGEAYRASQKGDTPT